MCTHQHRRGVTLVQPGPYPAVGLSQYCSVKIRVSPKDNAVADPGFSPGGGAPTPKSAIIFQFFAENCMKMKEFGPPGGGRASLAPPLGSANATDVSKPVF